MARYRFSPSDCRNGGQARAQMPCWKDAQLKGAAKTAERHGMDFLCKITRTWKRRKGIK